MSKKIELDYSKLSMSCYLNDSMIRENSNYLDWSVIGINQTLSEDIMDEFEKVLNWDNIFKYQNLNEEFIEKHIDRVDWDLISKYQKLSLEFIEKYIDNLNIERICKYQLLSEEFIDRYSSRLNWRKISRFQILSEDFIRKYENKVNWKRIFMYQKLSEEFIIEMIDKHYKNGYYEIILRKQNISLKFIKDNLSLFNFNCIKEICLSGKLDDELINTILSMNNKYNYPKLLSYIVSYNKIKPKLLFERYNDINLTDIPVDELTKLLDDDLFNDTKILKEMIINTVKNNKK